MPDKQIQVDKQKFDALLQKMLKTPPLPREELRGKKKGDKATKD
jgi:hypothetical protein